MAPGPPFPPRTLSRGAEGLTFAVIVLRELVASPAAAVSLAAERAHRVDAGLSQPAAVAARDALVGV